MQHVVLGWDTQTKCNAHVSCLYIITNSFWEINYIFRTVEKPSYLTEFMVPKKNV